MTDARPPRRRRPSVPRKGLGPNVDGVAARVPPPSPPASVKACSIALEPKGIPSPCPPASRGGAEANSDTRILVALARIEERQNSLVAAGQAAHAAAEARHTNVMQAIATFVPRSEIEKDNRALHERIDAAEKRLDTMEKRVSGAVAGAVSAFGLVILTKFGLMH